MLERPRNDQVDAERTRDADGKAQDTDHQRGHLRPCLKEGARHVLPRELDQHDIHAGEQRGDEDARVIAVGEIQGVGGAAHCEDHGEHRQVRAVAHQPKGNRE